MQGCRLFSTLLPITEHKNCCNRSLHKLCSKQNLDKDRMQVKNINANPRRNSGSSSLPSSNAAVTTAPFLTVGNNNSKVGLQSTSPSMVSVNNGVRVPETYNMISRVVAPVKSNPTSTMLSAISTKTTIRQDQHNSMMKNGHKQNDAIEISSRPSSSRMTTAPTSITRSTNEGKLLSPQENQTHCDHQGDDRLLKEWEKFVDYERPTEPHSWEVEAEEWQEQQRAFNIMSNFDEWADYATKDYEHLTWTTMHNMFSDVEEVTLFQY